MTSKPEADEQVLEHTPGPWYESPNPPDKVMRFRLTSIFRFVEGKHGIAAGASPIDDQESEYNDGNFYLALHALEVPHRCNVPDCPGPKNMARLNAAAALAAAAEEADTCMDTLRPSFLVMGRLAHDNLKAALAAYRALEQPETAGGNQ